MSLNFEHDYISHARNAFAVMTPLPILYTIPNFITAGSGQALFEVVKRLDRDRFSPTVCVLRKGGSLEEKFRELEVPVLCLPFTVDPRPIASLPLRILFAAKGFRKYHFVLWHSYHYSNDYTEPLIARTAGIRSWVFTKKNMSWNGRAWRLRTLLASGVAAQNTAMFKRFFVEPRLHAKVHLIPPGVDVDTYKPGVPSRLNLRQQLAIRDQTLLIGCVAHLVPVKGHPMLIRAMADVPEAHLLLAGKPLDNAYTQLLKGLVRELDLSSRVHFLENVSDVPALHAELDLFAFPTRMEGCPVALLEAMACGLSSIATNVPGPEDVIESGVNGILVESENVNALADAIHRLQHQPELRRHLGKEARKRILASYTIDREVKQLEEMYTRLIGSNHS